MEDRPSHSSLSKDDADDGLLDPDLNAKIKHIDTTTHALPSKVALEAELLDFNFPSGSPPLHRDLFIQSAFSTALGSKSVARLEAVIHTSPEKVKEYLTDFGSRVSSKKGVNAVAVVHERKGGEESVVAYKIVVDKVRKRLHAGVLFTKGSKWTFRRKCMHQPTPPPF